MSVKNLKTLSNSEFKSFLNSFDVVLSDCDGVIWTHKVPIPGIGDSIAALRKSGKMIKFVSNNNYFGLVGMYNKLVKANVEPHLDSVIIPSLVMIDYLKSIKFDKEIFIIGSDYLRKDFTDAGFKVSATNLKTYMNTAADFFNAIKDNLNVGAVIFDFDPNLNYVDMANALLFLERRDVILMYGAQFNDLILDANTVIIGFTAFQAIIKEASGRTPLEFAKPSLKLQQYVTEKYNIVDPQRVLFIGDSLDQDMAFATQCGYKKLLVLTGSTNLEQVDKCTNVCQIPDYYVSSLSDVAGLIEEKLQG